MKTVPTYTFDHDIPPASRWDALPQRLRCAGRLLAGRAFRELTSASPLAAPGVTLLRLATKWRKPGMIVVGREADEAVSQFEANADALAALQSDTTEDAP